MTTPGTRRHEPPTGASAAAPPYEQLGRSFKAAIAPCGGCEGATPSRPDELSHAQYGLLFGLREHEQLVLERARVRRRPLARRPSTQMLDALLAAAGLVRRERSERDRARRADLADRARPRSSRSAGPITSRAGGRR